MMLSVWLSSTIAKEFDLQVGLRQLSISLFAVAALTAHNPFSCPENLKSGNLGSLNKNLVISQPQGSWQG